MEIDWKRVCVSLDEKAQREDRNANTEADYAFAKALRAVSATLWDEIVMAERVEDDRRHS